MVEGSSHMDGKVKAAAPTTTLMHFAIDEDRASKVVIYLSYESF